IQTRSYDNQQGQRVYVTEVVAESFQLLESRTAREGQGGGYSAGNSFAGGNDYNSPYQAPAQSTPNFAREESPFGASNPMDISDDDLPF
ncbi:TPA: single-stranded DNA-binding protein, partial [Streptococcus suis]|nr:single-stranded DNA-binding protein [Streptococcus suis]HEM4698754.1 single-stranded DNA-binding protein [Streptococcus suis]HEM4719663.1 single-stranded DNA-binding protein [Streptococcus suis]HEM4753623.1 single-stranded DNA-binding protein [Streptococcus suis]HEM4760274.1 single-stranded DNA-binding protein [Streptococcus suis]